MKAIHLYKLIPVTLALLTAACSPRLQHREQAVREIKADTLHVNYQQALVRTLKGSSDQKDTLEFDFTYWGGWKDSEFFSDTDTILITNDGVEQEFIHWVHGSDTTVLDIYKQLNPATYDAAYKDLNAGKVNVVIPQVYELVHILTALTHNPQPNWLKQDTPYHARVQEYFGPYRNHPVIAALEAELRKGNFLNIRENSAAFDFDGKNIIPSNTYSGFRARDKVRKLLPLVQDFATKSDFLSFYQREQAFYESLISLEQERAQVKEAWDWLQVQFPARVDAYRLIMSPLAGGSHSIRLFENNSFKENIIFVSAPAVESKDSVSVAIADALVLRRAFTEIDHNYVNPVSDHYLQEIDAAMAHLGKWNTKGSYNSPYATFNEYMTWAVFGVYVYDRFGETAYRQVMQQPVDFMENSRGFVRFGKFNRHLLELFKKYKGEKKVSELYPEILEWVKLADRKD